MKKYLYILLFLNVCFLKAQKIGDFKYVIVPEQFEIHKHPNQYNLGTLSKYLFESIGFQVVYDNENYPKDLAMNSCLALKPVLEVQSNMFQTKMIISLKDCFNNIVFKSEEGICRKEKDNKISNQSAFRDAAKSFSEMDLSNYKIDANISRTSKNVEMISTSQPNTQEIVVVDYSDFSKTLYAQEIENGYQLIDSTPRIIMKLTKTSNPDLFLVKYGEVDAILMKKNNNWVIEYTLGSRFISEVLNIKF